METKLKREKNQKQSGFSIMEMLVAIAIFSILLLVSADSFWKATQSIQEQNKFVTRTRIFQNLIYMMGLPSSVRSALDSAGPTSDLMKCIRGVVGFNCQSGTLRDISLYLPPVTTDGVSVFTSGAISGPPSSPIRYNFDGEICDPLGTCPPEEFPISVSTQYDAICPPAYDRSAFPPWVIGTPINPAGLNIPGQCWNAHYIKIYYRFETTPGAPSEMSFPTMTGAIYVSAVAMRWIR